MMEAILRSVLLRQEQMEMQWDAEFAQQKQLFHINTSTLVDLLPIQPRKKRLKLEGRVQGGPIPSHDKENLVAFQGFLANGASAKSPKTIAPPSRGLAKRDLNMRFSDNAVKDVGRIGTKLTQTQPSLRNCLDAENLQQNANMVHAIKSTNQDSIGVSVKVEVDEDDVRQMHIPPPTDEFPSVAVENRKRIRGEPDENIDEQNIELPEDPKEMREQTNQTTLSDLAEKNTKPERARKVGKAEEPEIVCKVEVESEVPTCRDAQVIKTSESEIVSKVIIESEISSKGPTRRGRAKGALTVSQASGKDIESEEPIRRGRAKQTTVPQVEQRVTRSRARMVDSVVESKPQRITRSRVVESVVESEPVMCEQMLSTQVVSKESAQQEVKLEALLSEAEGQNRPSNQIVEKQMEAEVCAPLKEITPGELRFKKSSSSKSQKSVTRVAQKDSEDCSVANGMVKRGQVRGSSHADSLEGAVSSRAKSGEQGGRINSRDHLKDGQHESQPQPQLDRIEKGLGHQEVAFAPAEHPLPSMCEETELQDCNAPPALSDATTGKEETAKNAHCLVASVGDALVEEVIEDMAKAGSPIQLEVVKKKLQACIRACEAGNQRLGKGPPLTSNVSSISEISRTPPPNTKEAYTTLLSDVIEGSTPPSEKLGDPVLAPESLIWGSSHKPSLQSGRISSVAIPLDLSEAGNDASASEVHVLPTAGMSMKSPVADFSVAGRDGSGEHPVGILNMLASERQGSGSDMIIDEDSIEANEEQSKRERRQGLWSDMIIDEQTKRESMQDVVMNTTSEASHVKEPTNSRRTSKDEASSMDLTTPEQVKSDAVSPVGYSEARAIEEAIRCSLEQEFHPDVTLTLNRFQFRKRLSPRSKARARRWRSDVATNGVDYGRGGQSSGAPTASPSRVVSSRDRSLEGAAYETFLEAQSPEVPVQGAEPSFTLSAGKAIDQADTISQQDHASQSERSARRSISSLCNEVLSQPLRDGKLADNTVEYEIMETADEENENLGSLPLLQSIYTLSKACQDDMVGAPGLLEGEQQQVHSLIESAKKIMEQVSRRRSQAVGAPLKTPASNYPALNNSRFHGHTNLYPDRFRLFITPGSSSAAAPTFPPSASTIPGDTESTSPGMKDLIQETIEQAVSGAPFLDSVLLESAAGADNAASPSPPPPPSSGKLTTTLDTDLFVEGENALKCSPAVGSGSKRFKAVDPIEVHLASDALPNKIVPGTSTIGPASPLPASQNVGDDNIRRTGGLPSAVSTADLVMRQCEGLALGLESSAETERLSELRSRFYALSKEYVEISSTVQDVPIFLGDEPVALISHSTNPPSPTPNLRFSSGYTSKGARLSVKKKPPRSPEDVHFDAGENEEPAVVVVVEGETRIPCSPIFVGNQRERVEGTSEPAEEPEARSQSMAVAGPASMLRVEPQCSSNLISDVPSMLPSNSGLPRSNLVSSMRSFIPLVQQQQPAAPYPNGKRDVKVKALEAAEAAKRLAEQKEFEKQERKKAAELAKREKQERAALEKLAKREKAAQDKLIKQQEVRAEREIEEANKRKTVAAGPTKPDSTTCQGTNVLLKVKKTHELKLKMDQEKQERLLEEQRRKEEEWRKKESDNAARKRKHEAAEKKEREEKRRRQEEAMKAHREMEERQRLELEKKTSKQRALEELEKERKAIEEEMKRQKRLDKEREVEQRRKKEEEKELAWLDMKEATRKRKEEAVKQMKLLEAEGRQQQAAKIRRPSEDPAMPSTGPYHSFMASLHIALGIEEGVGAHLSGVNSVVDPQRASSQSLVGHPLRVPQHSAEWVGACRNSQAALRVPRTTTEGVVPGVPSVVLGTGRPLSRTPPEALGITTASASIAVSSGGGSTTKILRERINILQGQPGSKTAALAVVGGSKPCQPGQVGFAGPPGGVIGQGDKGVQTYEISPFRDSEDEDSELEEKPSQKPIPQWARKENIMPQLVRQLEQDPDNIFVGASSCSLDEVFEVKGSKKRPDFKRRGSSGDWAKDCLTWQEQVQYKLRMGYLH